jgi:alginate O-acetyltransferase complex protein AlgI
MAHSMLARSSISLLIQQGKSCKICIWIRQVLCDNINCQSGRLYHNHKKLKDVTRLLFNSYGFIFLFLPVTFAVYFLLNKYKLILLSKAWLTLASLFFYGWWNPVYIPLIIGSILFNYVIGGIIIRKKENWSNTNKKIILIIGISGNIILLCYYKYMDFFISNINGLINAQLDLLQIALPLGISFFTFTQIAYLVDSYKGTAKEYSFLNYSLFVTFFPHLLAGPIIHHKEMMPQFDRLRNKTINYRNLSVGLYLFSLGLIKKIIIAERFALWANSGFGNASELTLFEAWVTSLSYTFQLYFDFSGYTDMALGSALMFNIQLPANFNSPYKSLNIQDFWRRWHMTLSRFLRDYIYIPLGGNRRSESRTLLNLMLTFLIGGLWHGAGWTFVFWGFLHGLANVIHRLWVRTNIVMPKILSWLLTFGFVSIAWIFFRAKTFGDAIDVLKGMIGLNGISLPDRLSIKLEFLSYYGIEFKNWLGLDGNIKMILMILISLFVVLSFKNSNELSLTFKPTWMSAILLVILAMLSFSFLNNPSEFIYFDF